MRPVWEVPFREEIILGRPHYLNYISHRMFVLLVDSEIGTEMIVTCSSDICPAGTTKEYHVNPESGWSVPRQRFEPSISQTQVLSAAATSTCLILTSVHSVFSPKLHHNLSIVLSMFWSILKWIITFFFANFCVLPYSYFIVLYIFSHQYLTRHWTNFA